MSDSQPPADTTPPDTLPRLDRVDPSERTAVAADTKGEIRFTDCHCHVAMLPAGAVEDDSSFGVRRLVDIGLDFESSTRAAHIATITPGIWATAGVDPARSAQAIDGAGTIDLAGIEMLLFEPEVVGVGECGLDFSVTSDGAGVDAPLDRDGQRAVFAAQIALAKAYDKLLVVHTRQDWDDTFDVLRGEGMPDRVVITRFGGNTDIARLAIELGIHLSFDGRLLMDGHDELREIVAKCPLDMIHIESASPHGPAPGGMRYAGACSPRLVRHIGLALAQILGRSLRETALITWSNSRELYHLR